MEITTSRLILREFTPDDWRAVLAYQSDPRYLEFYPLRELTPQAVQEFVDWFVLQQTAQPRTKFQLAITLKETGALIGNCGIRLEYLGAREANIGYELNPEYWFRGYATESARAIVDFGFSQLHLHRITAECNAENVRSARVLEKLGMQREGRLREAAYFKGRWWDTLLYAILEQDYQP